MLAATLKTAISPIIIIIIIIIIILLLLLDEF